MKKATKYFYLFTILCGIGCFFFFYEVYTYHLLHREQMLLFTYTAEQLHNYLNHPAFLSCLIGDFLTQFLHQHTSGAVTVTLTLILLEILTFFSCRKWANSWIAAGIAFLVFIWEGLRFCDINYPLAGTISLIGALSLFLLSDRLSGKWSFMLAGFCGTLLSFFFFGYGVFVFAFLTFLNLLTRRKNYIGGALIPITAAVLPGISTYHYLMMPSKVYTYPATVWYGKPNFTNERILGLNTEYYYDNWDKINELVFQGTPTNDASVCYNLANAMTGKLPERLMYYYQPAALGLFMPIYEKSTYLSTQLAGEVWFRLGDMTMAEHAAILSMIFSPNNKGARMVQRLAEINLINGEKEATEKYLNILSKTLYYKQWAAERMPGKESESVEKWLKQKRSLLPKQDTLRLSCTDVVSSLHLLLEANPSNQMAVDYLLCFHLLMKDLPNFVKDYKLYYKGKPNRLYSEALMIHLFRIRAKATDVKVMEISPSVVKDFNSYNRTYNLSHGNASALENQYGRSYWFYYHFAKFN